MIAPRIAKTTECTGPIFEEVSITYAASGIMGINVCRNLCVDVEGADLLEHRSADIFASEQPLGHLFARPCRTYQSPLDDINEVSLEAIEVCLFGFGGNDERFWARAQRTLRIVTDDVYKVPGANRFAAALDSSACENITSP